MRNINGSSTILLHNSTIKFVFSILNFTGIAEQGEQWLLELVPVVENTRGTVAGQKFEVRFEPLQGSTS